MNITKVSLLAGVLAGLLPCLASAQVTLSPVSSNIPSSPSPVSLSYDIDGDSPVTSPSVNPVAQRFDIVTPSTTLSGVYLFCIELSQYSPGVTTPYGVDALSNNLNERGAPDFATRADNIQKLYAWVFQSQSGYQNFFSSPDPTNIQAFQLALWNLVYEDDKELDSSTVSNGTLFVATSGYSSTIMDKAEEYIKDSQDPSKNNNASWLPTMYALENPVVGQVSDFKQDYAMPAWAGGSFSTVPEPSTYALLCGVATFGVVTLRRRLRKSAA